MLLAEFTIEHPILRETLSRRPGDEVRWEDTHRQDDGPSQMLCWVRSDDFEAVDAAMAEDPSVAAVSPITRVDGRRLYRVDFTALGDETDLVPEFVSVGAVMDEAVGTHEGWRCRAQFPDRDAVERIYAFCRDRDIPFGIDRLYERTEWEGEGGPSLTEAQRETLLRAVECGYLEIPRACSLAELGGELGVSESAASERFRRGVKRLVEETLTE